MASTEEWIKKMWYTYTMKYYPGEKNNNIMKFAGKWKELENILSEVTQTQKDKHDAKGAIKESPEFDLHFEKICKWVASSTAEKNAFISCIWKLNQRYLSKEIDVVNVSSQLLEESVPSGKNQSVTGRDEEAVDEYQELNAREKQDIEIMMEGCECAISNEEMLQSIKE
ncbi:hypothetical protein STEG23_036633 [Scotinomys teguina]